MSTSLSVKVKTKTGLHVINDLNENATIALLTSRIADVTRIPQREVHILIGFPPKPLDLSNSDAFLKHKGIKNNETLIVEAKPVMPEPVKPVSLPSNTKTFDEQIADGADYMDGILMKKVVPADNSCLFTSIGYVLNGKIDTDCNIFMRSIIAEHVRSDKETYNEAILGKPNVEYCSWILKPESWGGAIEVSILSNFYGVEIDVVDITNAIINRFGEDKSFGIRVFLLFDGIHYDPLYMESLTDGPPKTMFPIEDENAYKQAQQIAMEAKSSRQFTDVNKFTLRCIQCDCLLTGQVEAQEHAKTTGHTNFGEV